MNILESIQIKYPEINFITLTGFDDAIIGVCLHTSKLIYSSKKCMEILVKDMSVEEAEEHYSYNIVGFCVSNFAPILCDDIYDF